MIPAVNGGRAAVAALLFLLVRSSPAAGDPVGAARELARKTASFTHGPVAVTYRNLSSLPDSQLALIQREFESIVAGTPDATPPTEARITISENASDYLLVEEAHRGEDARVWIASWKRASTASVSSMSVAIETRLVWEQDEPILDVSFAGETMAVLSPSRVSVYVQQGTEWRPRQTLPIELQRPLPRDPRGRMRLSGSRIQAWVPGFACAGTLDAAPLACQAGSERWALESGGRDLLLASFAADRNYFEGGVTLQNGSRKTAPPFYSAAAVEDASGTSWLLATLDGETRLMNPAFEPVMSISFWGSDLVGLSSQCAESSPVLATRVGDAAEADAVQAFAVVNHAAFPLSGPAPFPGPVTALWPSTATSAVAVVRDLGTATYRAYVLTLHCGP